MSINFRVMYDGFKNPKYIPCPLLVNMVTGFGKLGVKTERDSMIILKE